MEAKQPAPGAALPNGKRDTVTSLEPEAGKHEEMYRPSPSTGNYYEKALKKCREINKDLQLASFDPEKGSVNTMVLRMTLPRDVKPKIFTPNEVANLVKSEQEKVSRNIDSRAPWKKMFADVGIKVCDIATKLAPIIDKVLPESPEYTVPYGCLMIVLQGIAKKKEVDETALGLLRSLSDDLALHDFYQLIYPTNYIRETVTMIYIQVIDQLHRLAQYFGLGSLVKLWNAFFPRDKFDFASFASNIKTSVLQLEKLCRAAQSAETRTISNTTKAISSDTKAISNELKLFKGEVRGLLTAHEFEIHHIRQHLERLEYDQTLSNNAVARYQISELFEIWDDQVGPVENELQLWQKPHFFTDPRDHWSHNNVLDFIGNWRKLTFNSIFWVSSEGNGRQAWMTEFSLDLICVARSNQQMTTFALCDRPNGPQNDHWTAETVMKQLISQLLHLNPLLAIEEPEIFNTRAFRRARTFTSTIQLLSSIIARLDSLLIVIDRIDLCRKDKDFSGDQNIVLALSNLTKRHPKSLRTIVTSAGGENVQGLRRLGISLAIIKTRRRPHRR